jgi:hypothetical protein
MLKTLAMAGAIAAALAFAPAAHAAPVKVLNCNGTFNGGTYKSVRVHKGADCTLIGATVILGVQAKDAASVQLISTTVGHNINIRGTTGLTKIGPANCGIDPTVGNNVMVRESHDVLICQVHAKNNIMVTGNDGQITVRDSRAGNIMVNHNKAWAGPPINHHPNPGAIRILRDVAKHHIHVFKNDSSRDLILRGDHPTPVVHA